MVMSAVALSRGQYDAFISICVWAAGLSEIKMDNTHTHTHTHHLHKLAEEKQTKRHHIYHLCRIC